MSCPWAKIEKPEPVNFEDIVSEEVARDLNEKERRLQETADNERFIPEVSFVDNIPLEVPTFITDDDFKSDAMIAQVLQIQFDKEHDDELKRTEGRYNGSSKVSICFDNYRRAPLNCDFDSEPEEEEIVDKGNKKDTDRFDLMERELASIPPCGYKMQEDGNIVTKHDITLCGRKNACKLLSFPPEFQTGDGEKFDLKLSNKVFNSLKLHSYNEQSRKHKVNDKKEEHDTVVVGMNESTRLLVLKLVNDHLLQRVNSIISRGKEAVIFHAYTDLSYSKAVEPLPKECVIKVFKTTASEYKQRNRFIKGDNRFKDRIGKQTTRKSVHLWAEKEMANLMRLRRAGIPCPQVVKLKQHVLVMSFIGENHTPAPKLKNAKMTDVDYIMAYEQVVKAMKTIYEGANLIHTDLSEYNILWHDKQCYFIDVSQSVEPCHENAFEFLHNDCINVTNFFTKKGVPKIATPDELFKYITGYDFSDKASFSRLQEAFKMKPHLVGRPGFELLYDFEIAWEKARSKRTLTEVKNLIPQVDVNLVEPPKA